LFGKVLLAVLQGIFQPFAVLKPKLFMGLPCRGLDSRSLGLALLT